MWFLLGCTWIDERALDARLALEEAARAEDSAGPDTADTGDTGGAGDTADSGDTAETAAPTPDLRVGADALDLGAVLVGVTATGALPVENLGDADLVVTVAVTGAGWSLPAADLRVAPGESAAVGVSFAPAAAGSAPGTLTLTTNDPDAPTLDVPLSAEGDADGDDDGADLWTDCDDADPAAHPGGAEVAWDGVDNDCDGLVDPMAAADAGWTILGTTDNDALGSGGVRIVADLDGTGLAELLVASPGADTGTRDVGLVGVHGTAGLGTLRGDARLLLTGNNADDWFGSDLAPLGDLDGNGHVEIAVGSYQNDIYGTDDGTVYVVEPAGLDGVVVGAVHTTSILYGDSSAGWLGYAVAGGDFDGDGVSELAAGAPGENAARGEVYVAGAIDGLGAETLDADTTLFRLTGVSTSDHLGYALAFGDLDDDGYADLVACSPDSDDAADGAGTCWIVAGEATRGSVSVPGVSVNAVDTASIAGASAGERVGPTGRALAVGDVDGDGRADLAVGVPGADGATVDGGAAWIFANGTLTGALGAGDATWALTGDGALGTSLALADVTGDGVADLIAGAPAAGPAGEGVVYLFAGGRPPGAYTLPADQDASFTGEATLDAFGTAVTGGQDLDGDGKLDLAVSAPGNDEGGANTGKVYVLGGYGP